MTILKMYGTVVFHFQKNSGYGSLFYSNEIPKALEPVDTAKSNFSSRGISQDDDLHHFLIQNSGLPYAREHF